MKGEDVDFKSVAEGIAVTLEGLGILVLVLGIMLAAVRYVRGHRDAPRETAYDHFRRGIGRSILLGLELLVAADIIHTVATRPSFESLGILGLLILIRTFLSIEIEMELEGRWPWQREAPAAVNARSEE